MALIGISGKKQHGKDTIALIIQYLICLDKGTLVPHQQPFDTFELAPIANSTQSTWHIKQFAKKLKKMVCLLIGCTMEKLEDNEFKEKELNEEWTRYGYANGFTKDNEGNTTMLSKDCDKERYELELRTNWQTAYKTVYTPRLLLQVLGTNCGRNIIHHNIWVNALFADYNNVFQNWIITDVRFLNEVEAIKKRNGFIIRVERNLEDQNDQHESEIALDKYEGFDYIVQNNGTIEELIEKIKQILIYQKIIQHG